MAHRILKREQKLSSKNEELNLKAINKMKSGFYNLVAIPFARILIFFAKMFNKKLARREKDAPATLSQLKKVEKGPNKRIWVHAASMGEFEQAKPIIEKIKSRIKGIQVIVSFFSPSGYENQKNYPNADAVAYLPFDTLKNVNEFLDIAKPDIVIFVRYEIWRNYLEQINLRKIPSFLACATEPSGKLMKSFLLKSFSKKNYNFFTGIFTVGPSHTKFFRDLGVSTKLDTLSDTRYDRIIENIRLGKEKMLLQEGLFGEGEFILVAGSTWKPDEDIIIPAIEKLSGKGKIIRAVFVPHEPTTEHVNALKNKLNKAVLLSGLLNMKVKNTTLTEIKAYLADNHLIVDSVGKLLSLYKYAALAYVGGGYGAGVHSVAEPAGYGIPLACGPKHTNSHDAVNLLQSGALSITGNTSQFLNWLEMYYDSQEKRQTAGKVAKDYIFVNKGATEIIVNRLTEYLSL